MKPIKTTLCSKAQGSRPPPQVPPKPRYSWRVDDLVEQRSAPDQQRETDDLQPLEGLPAETQRDEPDEERAAGVDCAARRGADLPGYGAVSYTHLTLPTKRIV